MSATPTPEQRERLIRVRRAVSSLGYALHRTPDHEGCEYFSVNDVRDGKTQWNEDTGEMDYIQEFYTTATIDHPEGLDAAIDELEEYVQGHPAIAHDLKPDPEKSELVQQRHEAYEDMEAMKAERSRLDAERAEFSERFQAARIRLSKLNEAVGYD